MRTCLLHLYLLGVSLLFIAQAWASPAISPIAQPLPPSPDPSTFTFGNIAPAASAGVTQLQIDFRLSVRSSLPDVETIETSIAQGLQQDLTGAVGNGGYTLLDVVLTAEQAAADDNTLGLILANVVLLTSNALLGRTLNQLEVTIQNAQLAGQIRVAGIYNLQRLSVDSYSLQPYLAPAPAPQLVAPFSGPGPVPAEAPLLSIAPTPFSLANMESVPSPMIATPGPGPSLMSLAPISAPPASLTLALPPLPTPAPSAQIEAPTASPNRITAGPIISAPAQAPSIAPNVMPAIPVEFPSAEYPAPSSGPQPSPAEPVQAPPPAPLATPVFAPAPVFPPSATVSRDIAPVPAPGSTHFEPQLGPGPAPAPNRLINVTVQLQGQNNLNSSGAAALQAVLANLTGQGTGQVAVQGVSPMTAIAGRKLLQIVDESESVASSGIRRPAALARKLLQVSDNVPVTIDASDYQQVLQSLGNLSSGSNLTSALQQAGLSVSNAHIIDVNGQEVISANLTTPAPSPTVLIPISQSGWRNKAILWGVLGGTIGLAILAALLACLGSRIYAWRIRKRFPPAAYGGSKLNAKAVDTPTSIATGDSDSITPKAQKGSQTVIGNESEPLMPDSSSETPMERHATTEEDENHYLVPTEGLDSYGGQFDYIVPSESQPMEMNIVEVPDNQRSLNRDASSPSSSGASSQRGSPDAAVDPVSKEYDTSAGTLQNQSVISSYAVMDLIASGKALAGRFLLEDGCIKGGEAIVAAAKDLANNNRVCMCKFISSQVEYTKELHLLELFAEGEAPLPAIVAAYPAGTVQRGGLPSAIVYEGADYSLSQWSSTMTKPPDSYQRRVILHMACKALGQLHRKQVVLGALTPDNILWFEAEDSIKLSSFSFWAYDGNPIPLHPSLRYAPPETIQESARGKQKMPASYAIDTWSLGAIAFNMFARSPIFGSQYSDQDVLQSLLGNTPLPWEMDSGFFEMIPNIDARNLVKNLLRKDPNSRWTMEQALRSPFFNGLPTLPYKPALVKNPSYPKPAIPRVTINPLTPLRSPESLSSPEEDKAIRRLHLPSTPPLQTKLMDKLEDTARELKQDGQGRATQAGSMPSIPPLPFHDSGLSTPEQGMTPAELSPREEWSNAMYNISAPSTPMTAAAGGPITGMLARDMLRNPAYSADAGPLPASHKQPGTSGWPPSSQQSNIDQTDKQEVPEGPSAPGNDPGPPHLEPSSSSSRVRLEGGSSRRIPQPTGPPGSQTGRDAVESREPADPRTRGRMSHLPLQRAQGNLKGPSPDLLTDPDSRDGAVEEKREVEQSTPPLLRSTGSQMARRPASGTSRAGNPTLSSAVLEHLEAAEGPSSQPLNLTPSRGAGLRRDDSLLLKTITQAGGHSRAGSAAGWESLEDYENEMSLTSGTSNLLSGPFVLRPIPYTALQNLRGSALVTGIIIEEIPASERSQSSSKLLPRVAAGDVETKEASMVPNKAASLDQPVFMMRLGAKFIFRVTLVAGSQRGWVPLPVTGPIKMRIGFARSDEGDTLEIKELESAMNKWKGIAIWDSSTPRVAQLAGKFGQQTRMVITTDYRRKGFDDIVSIEHEIYCVMCSRGQRMPSASTWTRGKDFQTVMKAFPWAQEAIWGAVAISKVGRQRPTRDVSAD